MTLANHPQTISRSQVYAQVDLAVCERSCACGDYRAALLTKNGGGNDPTPEGVDSDLRRVGATLAELEIKHGSSVLAYHLKASVRAHG
ncbi:UNVERIFIED_ORG: DsbC/DsbD-like thiol-disulfide interchange protein [Paraburkholderia sediminicola]|nr:DsbC/DsbD-like thiol-disulfide interchange protein [Paraburkholderia sediminicola]